MLAMPVASEGKRPAPGHPGEGKRPARQKGGIDRVLTMFMTGDGGRPRAMHSKNEVDTMLVMLMASEGGS